MNRNRWFGVLVLVLVCALCVTTGCRKKKATAAGETGGTIGEGADTGVLGPRAAGELKILSDVNMENVLFDYDSAQLRETERSKLEAAADYLKKNPKVGVIVEGHCDERGSVEYNMALGERRALAARAYLVSLGIDGSVMQTKSYGKERPTNPGHDESAWRVNRRDEFVFFEK